MKTMFAAVLVLAMGTGMAMAQGNGGPAAPITPFTIWSAEGAAGKPLTPLSELIRMAQRAPAQAPSVATAQNGQATHLYLTQSGRGTWLFRPAQNGNG
jgi:hypothetical protein